MKQIFRYLCAVMIAAITFSSCKKENVGQQAMEQTIPTGPELAKGESYVVKDVPLAIDNGSELGRCLTLLKVTGLSYSVIRGPGYYRIFSTVTYDNSAPNGFLTFRIQEYPITQLPSITVSGPTVFNATTNPALVQGIGNNLPYNATFRTDSSKVQLSIQASPGQGGCQTFIYRTILTLPTPGTTPPNPRPTTIKPEIRDYDEVLDRNF